MEEGIRVSIDGPVARITVHRPPLNVVTTEMLRDLAEAFDTAADDAGVRVVRLDAEGKADEAGYFLLGEGLIAEAIEIFRRERLFVPEHALFRQERLVELRDAGMEFVQSNT